MCVVFFTDLFETFRLFRIYEKSILSGDFNHTGVVKGEKMRVDLKHQKYQKHKSTFKVEWEVGIWTSFSFLQSIYSTSGNLTAVSIVSHGC